MRSTMAIVAALVWGLLGAAGPVAAETTVTVRDVAGREVTLVTPVKRILLGEGRQFLALALLHPDPESLLAAWSGDMRRQDKVLYQQYLAKFPGLGRVPLVSTGSPDTFSVEQALAAAPEVAILSGGFGPSQRSDDVVRKLESAGVPVVFIDFVEQPLRNTVPSIRLLGQLLGREARAEEFIGFYQSHMDRITNRLAAAKPALPNVLMHAHAGHQDCCNSPGRATIGAFVDVAGGHNIATDVLKRPVGHLSREYVISRNPDVYVGTGGMHLEALGGLVMGPGVDAARSRRLLASVVSKPGLAGLSAVRNGRVHGIWHLFNNMPLNVLAVEAMAKWFHPELFADVDPDASLRELNERFLPVPMQGTFWVSVDDVGARSR
ncbi:Periplasmic binding protein [Rhodopseudomonas palustris HaA2]|uniref:Periplasmic binding protein n=2 Tax=Rhodopseudomonas palustris TaxID=1076 RepID=Q2IWL2_RHOP2|nr:Periplasmic binding protein [Rhodopseudomonas palustris HaA2]